MRFSRSRPAPVNVRELLHSAEVHTLPGLGQRIGQTLGSELPGLRAVEEEGKEMNDEEQQIENKPNQQECEMAIRFMWPVFAAALSFVEHSSYHDLAVMRKEIEKAQSNDNLMNLIEVITQVAGEHA